MKLLLVCVMLVLLCSVVFANFTLVSAAMMSPDFDKKETVIVNEDINNKIDSNLVNCNCVCEKEVSLSNVEVNVPQSSGGEGSFGFAFVALFGLAFLIIVIWKN